MEPLGAFAAGSAARRPQMATVRGGLCGGAPGRRGGFVEDGHLSGLVASLPLNRPAYASDDGGSAGGGAGGWTFEGEDSTKDEDEAITCHSPRALLGAMGVSHVDLFVLDCEGCELGVVLDLIAKDPPPLLPPPPQQQQQQQQQPQAKSFHGDDAAGSCGPLPTSTCEEAPPATAEPPAAAPAAGATLGASWARVEVDAWVIEANDAPAVLAALGGTHDLAACLGTAPDLVLLRRGSAPWQRFFGRGGSLGGGGSDAGGAVGRGGRGGGSSGGAFGGMNRGTGIGEVYDEEDGAPVGSDPLDLRCPFDQRWIRA